MKAGWKSIKLREVASFDKSKHGGEHLPYVGLEDIESDTSQFIGTHEPKDVKGGSFRFTEKHVLYGRLRPYLNKAMAPHFSGHCSTEVFPQSQPKNYRSFPNWLIWHRTRDKINSTCKEQERPEEYE